MPLLAAPAGNVNTCECIYWLDPHAADSGTNKECKSTQLYLLVRILSSAKGAVHTFSRDKEGREDLMLLDGLERWAIVFLIIFVLFFLLVPGQA